MSLLKQVSGDGATSPGPQGVWGQCSHVAQLTSSFYVTILAIAIIIIAIVIIITTLVIIITITMLARVLLQLLCPESESFEQSSFQHEPAVQTAHLRSRACCCCHWLGCR